MPALGTRCSSSLNDTLNYGLETAVLENDSDKPEHLEQALWKLWWRRSSRCLALTHLTLVRAWAFSLGPLLRKGASEGEKVKCMAHKLQKKSCSDTELLWESHKHRPSLSL